MKYKVTANNKYKFDIESRGDEVFVNDVVTTLDSLKVNAKTFHVLLNNKSHIADIVELNRAEKYCIIKMNGNSYRLDVSDKYDDLLHQLGLDKLIGNKINEIKAPMPGMVLSILVKEGDSVKKGDNLFILEAMKMENIIKSPADGLVKLVKVSSGNKVEKNQSIILFQ